MNREQAWSDPRVKWRMLRAIKRKNRFYESPRFASTEIFRSRERSFVDAFFPRLLLVAQAMPSGKRLTRAVLCQIGVAAIRDSEFRMPALNKKSEATSLARKKADELLRLPRIQSALNAKFDAHGFTTDRCAEILAEIANAEPTLVREKVDAEGQVEREYERPTPGDRMRAVDMRVRMTVGYAPTKSATLQMHTRADQFYDKNEFDKNPGITLDEEGNEL